MLSNMFCCYEYEQLKDLMAFRLQELISRGHLLQVFEFWLSSAPDESKSVLKEYTKKNLFLTCQSVPVSVVHGWCVCVFFMGKCVSAGGAIVKHPVLQLDAEDGCCTNFLYYCNYLWCCFCGCSYNYQVLQISQCSRTPAESTVSNQEKAILKRDMALILLLAHKPVVIFLFWPIATLLSLTKQIANCIKMIFFVTVDIYDNAHSKTTTTTTTKNGYATQMPTSFCNVTVAIKVSDV